MKILNFDVREGVFKLDLVPIGNLIEIVFQHEGRVAGTFEGWRGDQRPIIAFTMLLNGEEVEYRTGSPRVAQSLMRTANIGEQLVLSAGTPKKFYEKYELTPLLINGREATGVFG